MQDIIEIRWHGRGGQGAKTAALLFGDAALASGLYIQAFPEYGPERMGAPVASFNRLSKNSISIHCAITEPDIVVVLDSTLIDKVNVLSGLSSESRIIINTSKSPQEVKKELKFDGKVFTLDASKISRETLGRDIPNTPMLGALTRVSEIIKFDSLLKDVKNKLEIKFAGKPEVIEGNLAAIKRAYEEVRS
jgi:pyruvate ferredoxin oxidoreductase gamma subunit